VERRQTVRKVLIVDDEKFIRSGLRAILERSDTEFKDIQERNNGRAALEKLSEENFDLVITDIKMPLMDGLALIREAQKKDLNPQFIILSGYEDFNFAVEALKYGVKSYLLKPVEKEELLDALEKVEKELEHHEQFSLRHEAVNSIMDRFRLGELSRLLLSDNMSEEEIRDTLKAADIGIFDSPFYIAILFAKETDSKSSPADCSRSRMPLIGEYLENEYKGLSINFIGPKDYIVIVSQHPVDYKALLQSLDNSEEYGFAIGVSELGEKVTDIQGAYLQASKALKYRLLTNSANPVIHFDEIKHRQEEFKLPLDHIKKIAQIIGTDKVKELDSLLSGIFSKEALRNNDIAYVERISKYINQHIIEYLNEILTEKFDSRRKEYEYITDIYKFHSLKEYVHFLREYLLEINAYLIALKDTYREKNEIDAAIQYLQENYHKDLNLAVVANYVSLNYSYFSHLFKEHTGTNFVDFLKGLRIEKAKELLRNTDYKISEIAQMVGYKNGKSFTKIFGEVTGISPGEYRNKVY
jgi:two-component system, response regulator YesN